MSDKYIIRNCPAILRMTKICDAYETTRDLPELCKDRTDCILKQIVGLCKRTCRMRCTNDCLGTKKHCGYGQILKLLDIQECE